MSVSTSASPLPLSGRKQSRELSSINTHFPSSIRALWRELSERLGQIYSLTQVFIRIHDTRVGDLYITVVVLPVVTQLCQPVEVIVVLHACKRKLFLSPSCHLGSIKKQNVSQTSCPTFFSDGDSSRTDDTPLSAISATTSLACTSIVTSAPRVMRCCFVSFPRTSSTMLLSC